MAERFTAQGLLDTLVLPRGEPPGQLLVAFSGGLDSSVLLHALVALRRDGALEGWRLQALHVDHGLHAQAPRWAAFCRDRAAALDVSFSCRRLQLEVAKGESEEAVARDARYAVLAAALEAGGRLLTAHHADDQLETVLLALTRGAGPAGLAGMPAVMRRGRGWHLRPLLTLPRAALHDYAACHQLAWLEDPANLDMRFARSYLRREIVPALRRRWPGIATSVARSARLCGASDALNGDLARCDLALAPEAAVGRRLDIDPLLALEEDRRVNALRYWLRRNGHPPAPERRLRAAARDLLKDDGAREGCVRWQDTELRRYRDRLYVMPPLPAAGGDERLALSASGITTLPPGLGQVALVPAGPEDPCRQRLSAARLSRGELSIGFRDGGERVRLPGRAGSRQLKRLLQEWAVVPWMRERMPLLRVDGEIAAIADVAVTAPFAAESGEAGLVLRWSDHPPLH